MVLTCLSLAQPLPALADGSDLERLGTVLSIALPFAAGYCAIKQGKAAEFYTGLAVETVVVEGVKSGLGDAKINIRPNGGPKGFPSGHMAAATFGATSLARTCFPDRPAAKVIVFGLALLTGYTRVHAGKHTWSQVGAGATVGFFSSGFTASFSKDSFGIGYRMEF